MAIADLLWRCPECGLVAGIRKARGAEVCSECGTAYRRAAGATITAQPPGKPAVTLSSQEWLDRLSALNAQRATERETSDSRAELRLFESETPVRSAGRFLGYRERLGAAIPGRARLLEDRLEFRADAGQLWVWPLDDITGLQPASRGIQIKVRNAPVFLLTMKELSPRMWEDRVEDAIRVRYRDTGRGEVREFQPRILRAGYDERVRRARYDEPNSAGRLP